MMMSEERSSFKVVENFITKEESATLADSFINYCNSSHVLGDNQSPISPSVHNFPLFVELLCNKVTEVSKIIGEQVLPTYAYARVYKKGSVLAKHTDREACEVSLTLNLKKDSNWPIFIVSEGKEVSVELEPGTAMLYKGMEAEHWRNEFLGEEYVQVFLHYVRSRGVNSFAMFDKFRTKEDFSMTGAISYDMIEDKLQSSVDNINPTTNKLEAAYTQEHIDELKKYIMIVKNALSKEDCKLVLKEYKKSDDWIPAAVGGGGIRPDIRNVSTIGMSQQPVIEKNHDKRRQIDAMLFERTNKLINTYISTHPFSSITQDTGYDLLRYETGGFYVQHTDSFTDAPREISCSLLLNDKFEGGLFSFFNGKISYKLDRGDAILFPSNFLYPHEITAVTNGTRYSIITWFR